MLAPGARDPLGGDEVEDGLAGSESGVETDEKTGKGVAALGPIDDFPNDADIVALRVGETVEDPDPAGFFGETSVG